MSKPGLRWTIASAGCAWLTIGSLIGTGEQLAAVEFRVQAQNNKRAGVFERPAVIIVAAIESRCESALLGGVRVEWVPRQVPTSFSAAMPSVLRLNGRRNTDPDPLSGNLTILQSANVPFIELSLGKEYLLLLNPAPGVRELQIQSPFYVFAVPQGGFRIDDDRRLVPLLPGGELDSYRGRMASDVIEEIEGRRKAIPKPPG